MPQITMCSNVFIANFQQVSHAKNLFQNSMKRISQPIIWYLVCKAEIKEFYFTKYILNLVQNLLMFKSRFSNKYFWYFISLSLFHMIFTAKKRLYVELLWSVFSHIRIKYGETLHISSCSVQIRENTGTFHAVILYH